MPPEVGHNVAVQLFLFCSLMQCVCCHYRTHFENAHKPTRMTKLEDRVQTFKPIKNHIGNVSFLNQVFGHDMNPYSLWLNMYVI